MNIQCFSKIMFLKKINPGGAFCGTGVHFWTQSYLSNPPNNVVFGKIEFRIAGTWPTQLLNGSHRCKCYAEYMFLTVNWKNTWKTNENIKHKGFSRKPIKTTITPEIFFPAIKYFWNKNISNRNFLCSPKWHSYAEPTHILVPGFKWKL